MVHGDVVPRQIWSTATQAAQTMTTAPFQVKSGICTAWLPSGAILDFNDTFTTTLSDTITFQAPCNASPIFDYDGDIGSGNSTVIGNGTDPFVASVTPQVYALAVATVLSYVLVILIFITPRTFYVGGPGGGAGFLGNRSMMPGTGSNSVIGIGRRPLLQKIATVTVAISLTIATADTFRVAEDQYNDGLMDSTALVEEVIGSTEIRVVRVISDTFLWLAQVQTLIRLFPRHKEKVTIKWLGFALVTLDAIFSVLENFVSKTTRTSPRTFKDAIPAVSYLFELSISLIYASCVSYYSLSKRRFAFWHSKMRNIFLVAILSLSSVLIPVVFFIIDIASPKLATWGEYIRWVGAAAASVVVWEWVERIEALERDERKDGILGREIFDGDEMLGMTPSENSVSGKKRQYLSSEPKGGGEDGAATGTVLTSFNIRSRIPNLRRKDNERKAKEQKYDQTQAQPANGPTLNGGITRPPQVATPISRSDTNSAASTIYAVRYHNISSPSPAIPEEPIQPQDNDMGNNRADGLQIPNAVAEESTMGTRTSDELSQPKQTEVIDPNIGVTSGRQIWQTVANPFKRRRAEPPAEVAAQIAESNARRSPADRYYSLRDRVSAFTVAQRRRLNGRTGTTRSPPMPVTFIPAQPRGSTTRGHSYEENGRGAASEQNFPENTSPINDIPRDQRHEHLPVTFIPPPVPGGRTWSPDELHSNDSDSESSHDGQGTPQNPAGETNSQVPAPGPSNPTNDQVQSIRGSLTISESPGRSRNGTSSTSPDYLRRSNRSRGTTMASITDRLNSVSPASMMQGSSRSETSQPSENREIPALQIPNQTPEPRQPSSSNQNMGSSI